ncbi:hypothetical protein E2562_035649 [Oryza meyeriana var. granulata]|uniref:Uncharacterized protein n=1 Tax=Oryza meyeriana var. granulata TaxID=110450 RepID=A0A6G1FFT6_9ORYZ|nr:hypothetical protein E2562_035649 [Oryza meyeriana var. granulata]
MLLVRGFGVELRGLDHQLRARSFGADMRLPRDPALQAHRHVYDQDNVTATWTGRDICGETTYLGFYCGGAPEDPTVMAVVLNGYRLRAPTLRGFVDQLPDLPLQAASGGASPSLANSPSPTTSSPDRSQRRSVTRRTRSAQVVVQNSQLSDCLPRELGLLTNAAVNDAAGNQITGPIPSSFACLASVERRRERY